MTLHSLYVPRAALAFIWLAAFALSLAGCHHKKKVAEPLPSIDDLSQQMQSKDKDDRYEAVKQLGAFAPGNKEAVPLLITALSDKDADVRWVATKGLGLFGAAAAEATPRLTELLRDGSSTVRAGAARALSTMGTAGLAARPALSVALNDPAAEVRDEAKRALKTLSQVQQFQSLKSKPSN
jgi:HEAT repeat protein